MADRVQFVEVEKPIPRTIRRSITACIVGNFFLRAAGLSSSIMLGLYLSYINSHIHTVSAIEVGWIGTGYYLTEFLAATPLGTLSDRYGRKLFILLGPFIGAIVVQIYPSVAIVGVIFVVLMLEGFSAASNTPATLGFLADATSHSARLRSRATALFEIGSLGGMAIGYLAGGLLWDRLGPGGFRLITVLYLLSAAILLWRLDNQIQPVRTVRPSLARYRSVLLSKPVLRLVPAWVAMQAILGVIFSQTAFQLSSKSLDANQSLVGGFNGTRIGIAFALFAIVFASGMYIWGTTLSRWKKTTKMVIASSGAYLTAAGLFLLNHSSLRAGMSLVIILFILLISIGIFIQSGFTPIAVAYLADLSEDFANDRGSIMGMYSIFLASGQLFGALIGGIFAQFARFDGVILICTILSSIAFVTVLWMNRVQPSSSVSIEKTETSTKRDTIDIRGR